MIVLSGIPFTSGLGRKISVPKWLFNMKLKHKIALAFIFLIMASSLLSAAFLYNYVASQIRETAYVNSADMMTQAGNFFDEKLKGIIRRVYALQLNDDFYKALTTFLFNEEKYRYALTLSQLSYAFSGICSAEEFISSIFLYTPKGEFFDLAKIKKQGFAFKNSELYRDLRILPGETLIWGLPRKDEIYLEEKMVIPLVVRFSVEGYNGDILLVVNLDYQEILNYLTSIYSGEGNWLLILDQQGREVVSVRDQTTRMLMEDAETIAKIITDHQGNIKRKYKRENYVISYHGLAVAPWRLVNIQSERILLHKLSAFGIFLGILIVVSIVVCLILALIISNSITYPLARLEKTIEKVRQRNFDIKFDYQYHDEVGQLGRSFNFMVEEIKKLIHKQNDYIARLREEKEKVKKEQLLKRRAELKALQAQINPHFLYNTLESIRWLADKVHATDISRMIMALGTLFRTGLNRGYEIISINDEIENVRSYLTIQKMRYGEQFTFTINVHERLRNLMTVKLILQPLVENAVYHGIKKKNGPGKIEIYAGMTENGHDIEFTVKDDGPGINPVALKLINHRMKEGVLEEEVMTEREGYGIYNVNERIKLYFGKKYGLRFYSEYGKGTEVKILIPAITKEEIGKYVQIDGS